jgi:hypothetical protein
MKKKADGKSPEAYTRTKGGHDASRRRVDPLATARVELMSWENLLIDALAIERDLSQRLSKRPRSRALRQQRKESVQLIMRLVSGYRDALDAYLASIGRLFRKC